ncbi:hypothetical protein WM40_01910 [Robbsia andropogonis]|uniref:Uncharacterized protein n=1 Tax=Robbsia andropogonis TaxID=28092 RepID=A0A0F5K5E8_9BURK|nr:hypothetical protein WM40_01910 [Robbsia andropogonis]
MPAFGYSLPQFITGWPCWRTSRDLERASMENDARHVAMTIYAYQRKLSPTLPLDVAIQATLAMAASAIRHNPTAV